VKGEGMDNIKILKMLFIFLFCIILCLAKNNSFSLIQTNTSLKMNPLNKLLSLSTTNTWKEFSVAPQLSKFKEEKLAWTWSLKLRTKQALKLKEINLQWIGDHIDKLYASLYQKRETDPVLIPIEENWVCDGTWNAKNQKILFKLDEKLVAVNNYYLVLSFPQKIEPKLKKGTFVLPAENHLKVAKLP
jgi:hypothetical protein